MIEIWTGEDDFGMFRVVEDLKQKFPSEVKIYDNNSGHVNEIQQIFLGLSLFDDKKVVVLNNWSKDKNLWEEFSKIVSEIDEDLRVICIEPKPDKRLKAYKTIKAAAKEKEFKPWGNKINQEMIDWTLGEANKFSVQIDKKMAENIISRTGNNQALVWRSLEKMSFLTQPVSEKDIENQVPLKLESNAFLILENAISGKIQKVSEDINNLKTTEEPHRLFGLLVSQALLILFCANIPKGEDLKSYAGKLGVHPFALSSSDRLGKKLGVGKSGKIVEIFSEADILLKSTSNNPWNVIELALNKISNL